MSACQRLLDQIEALEDVAEDAIELVEIALVLHQRRAREIVEVLHPAAGEVLFHRLHQREVFAQRHRKAGGFQLVKEGREHVGAAPGVDAASQINGSTATGKLFPIDLKIYLALYLNGAI